MLVYIRESDKEKIVCNVDEKDIAEHLRVRLTKVQEEKEQKRKEKADAHLYTIIKVARDEELREQLGKCIFFDLVDHDKVRGFRIQKQTSFALFKDLFPISQPEKTKEESLLLFKLYDPLKEELWCPFSYLCMLGSCL